MYNNLYLTKLMQRMHVFIALEAREQVAKPQISQNEPFLLVHFQYFRIKFVNAAFTEARIFWNEVPECVSALKLLQNPSRVPALLRSIISRYQNSKIMKNT